MAAASAKISKSGFPRGSDSEFLPAAVEILVTPPSPIATSLMLSICALFSSVLVWSYVSWIDIYDVAPGKIQPVGGSKVVQPLEPGRVSAINVDHGSQVKIGDVLLKLDLTEAITDLQTQKLEVENAAAEIARFRAAISSAKSPQLQLQTIAFPDTTDPALREREQAVLEADIAQLRSNVESIRAQIAEKRATRARLTATVEARQKLIALADERVGMRRKLEDTGGGSRAMTIEALQDYNREIAVDAGDRGEIGEEEAAENSLTQKLVGATSDFIADQSRKLAEVENKSDQALETLIKSQWKVDAATLRSPISGTVEKLGVTSIGQVVTSGQSVMTIVPVDSDIDVRALIPNAEIGFVKVGQSAVIKIDAYPFTRYGTIEGTVAEISRDAVDERDATEFTDAANAAKSQRQAPSGSSAPLQNLVFPCTIRLSRRSIIVDGAEMPLKPGMAVSVEIRTGHRRAIDYLLSPLREVADQVARER